MMHKYLMLVSMSFATVACADKPIVSWIDTQMPALIETYQWLHAHPEVSFEEKETASFVAGAWRESGYDVTTEIGGYGIVGILKNGDGPIVMLRTDLDALPVTEQTPLPFASTVTTEREGGGTTGVMHACGHDLHMTNLIGVAKYLAEHKSRWSGTLMLVGQPAEERGAGAAAMLQDGLFERFPQPDFAVALHVHGEIEAGTVAVMPGYALANVDSVDITVKGRGGHGSAPHTTIDPIMQAAELIVSLQTIVSREVKPIEPAVVTIGSIHGGTKHNIIGNDCKLQLTVRSYSDEVRQKVLGAIKRKANAVAAGYDAPAPEIIISEGTPSLKNDAKLTKRLRQVFIDQLGADAVSDDEPSMGGEDFSRYGRAGVPIVMYRLGSVSRQRLDRFEKMQIPPPSLHSAVYYPDVVPALRTGIQTMAAAAMELLQAAD
tara:strand:- start:93106 stop:94404 length:1299 start_codon:yes stop_codon:yes gene_type:complete